MRPNPLFQATKPASTVSVVSSQTQAAANILKEDDEFEDFPVEEWQLDTDAMAKLDVEQWDADWESELTKNSTNPEIEEGAEFGRQLRAEVIKLHQAIQQQSL